MYSELAGGLLIGLAAAVLWLGIGRISGMTGVMSSLFALHEPQRRWSLWFFIGLVAAYPLFHLAGAEAPMTITDDPRLLIAAGLLVGFGTYIGNGCTSGHGVCGMGRLSLRSVIATLVFMAAGIATVAVMNQLGVSV
ncbi:YeeE/YedE family protein [Thalassolituus sp.]|jgi:uncharacterized membrane protein YedE/YeeE|uniref:YeeE/YedE family protein n=1 Tax=Thalassolituus sp. TaxID=2030822 RepID=UPI00351815D0|nr:MAG: hypothetical protein CSH36_14300 [Thalassolituus sp.]